MSRSSAPTPESSTSDWKLLFFSEQIQKKKSHNFYNRFAWKTTQKKLIIKKNREIPDDWVPWGSDLRVDGRVVYETQSARFGANHWFHVRLLTVCQGVLLLVPIVAVAIHFSSFCFLPKTKPQILTRNTCNHSFSYGLRSNRKIQLNPIKPYKKKETHFHSFINPKGLQKSLKLDW